MFKKLTPHTLRGRIAQQVREAILSGTLKEGERLVERKLAIALGASLTAVREALIELESEGFILKKTNLGTYVTKMSFDDVEKVFQVRRVLEAYAVGEAAQHGTSGQVEKLERIYMEMVDAARAKDTRAFNQQDMCWHLLVWEMSGNEYLQAALRRAVLPYFAFTAIRIATVDPLSLLRDAYEHLPLLEAIKAHDADGARNSFVSTVDDWLAVTRAEFARASELQPEASNQAPALV
ncbi:MAG: GntR family transcriptional regulator [Bryobacteraceae bacterium]|jgi:DNA-binding GntR family transcriptional regulator